jgi:hypothetical protein
VGTVVHEFSHSLGLPDLYDVDGEGSGGYAFDLNFWDLMAVGSWNNEGHTPAGINAWLKGYMGWMDIPVISATGSYTLAAAIDNPQAFRLNTPVYNEYFIVENRQRTGFDSYIPGEGMLIYQVDLNYPGWLTGEINVDPLHQGFDLLEADDIRDTVTLPGDPFPGTAGITSFDSLTVPGSNTRNGMASGVSIQNITTSAGVISFEVQGSNQDELPEGWSVDELSYTQLMEVTAMVDTGGSFVTSGALAAFVGEECRGVATAVHDPTSGNHLFMLYVFSNATGGEELSFRYYDPVRDSIHMLFETVTFAGNTMTGSTDAPFLFHVPVRYTRDFVRGWNWFSLNVAPKDLSPASVFTTCASAGDYVKNQTSSTTYYGSYGWFGGLKQMGTKDLYLINATGSCGIDISGLAVEPSKEPLELVAGWNWVAYHPRTKLPIGEALATLSPTHLDYVKNQSQSATYYNNYGWFGTLDTLRSGDGYMMRLAAADVLQYPDAAPDSKAVPGDQPKSAKGLPPWSYNANDYEHSGELNAVVIRGGEEMKSGYLGAFVGDECRGYVEARLFGPTSRTIFVLLIGSNASSGETISFRYYDGEEEREYFIEETLAFESNMRVGSAMNPEEYHVSENSPPVADCPPAGSVAPWPGPVVFDYCRIFSDPDGDPLVYDVEHSENSKVSWKSACELEFTPAEAGVSTLTLIASDGKMEAECRYSFTAGSSNSPPELVRPLGVLRLDEGFEIFVVDLDTVFRDPDGDQLTYEAVTAGEGVVTVSVEGSRLVVAELLPGNVQVRVSASDGEFSAVDRAEVVVVAAGPPPPWEFSPSNYLYKGQIDALVLVNGASVTSGVLGAFVGRSCRGIAKGEYFSLTGKTVFSLQVHSNLAEGDMLTFRYYDTFSEVVFATEEVIPFRADMKLGNALNPVPLNIVSKNHLPVVDVPIGNQEVDEHFGSVKFGLTEVFSDPDGDPLTYRVEVDDPSVAVGEISEGVLTIGEVSPGVCRFVVSAGDGIFSIDDRFTFTIVDVNDPPEVVEPVPDQQLQEGFGVKSINISGTFWDPDGDVLQYSVSADDPSVVVVSLSGSNLVLVEAGTGEAVVTLCVSDGEFEVCDVFTVTVEDVNFSPAADCALFSDTVVFYGSGGFVLEAVCDRFSDPDGDELTITVESSDPAIAFAVLDGCSLGVTVLGTGVATVTVCADDGELEVCCAFEVVVVDENAMELFVMDRQLFEGDTIGQCSEADTVVLIVYSVVPWSVESESGSGSESGSESESESGSESGSGGAWFTVEKTNIYNAEIVFSENGTGAARSGSIAVRDTQEHVVNLVVHQSADCSGTSVVAGGRFGVRCYPNPVSGRLAVELDGELFDGAVVLELIDVYGKRLQEVLAGEVIGERGAFYLEMGQYVPGVYFLRIADSAGPRVVVPVVKE